MGNHTIDFAKNGWGLVRLQIPCSGKCTLLPLPLYYSLRTLIWYVNVYIYIYRTPLSLSLEPFFFFFTEKNQ
ncbi:unnamed protein product [Coffea canephora]|uniref:Uncharacterized protein n=1 Tax=Coffea canephora TaxID=49390 RepID=A0A068UZM4_COFCA|nr:unnamed protein product [Coffea canephora]